VGRERNLTQNKRKGRDRVVTSRKYSIYIKSDTTSLDGRRMSVHTPLKCEGCRSVLRS
jgi:hypothetical protein